jgi:succinate dehydrogenase / fumarate reductase cytochrome b subunit
MAARLTWGVRLLCCGANDNAENAGVFMADTAPQGKIEVRDLPLSPHLQIWRWTVTMAASIAHRATGMALYAGTAFLAWWLLAIAAGTDAYTTFQAAAGSILGLVVLFGFVWSLCFHMLNGLRHLAWDVGYGFAVPTAKATATLVFVLSLVIAVLVFWFGYMNYSGAVQ